MHFKPGLVRAAVMGLALLMLLGGCAEAVSPAPSSEAPVSAGTSAISFGDTPTSDRSAVPVTPLDTHRTWTVLRQRRTASDRRLVIDAENPVFLFRAFGLWGRSLGERAVATYRALPEDIRPFTVLYLDNDGKENTQAMLRLWHEALDITDAAGVPVILQIEWWNSFETHEAFTEAELSELLTRHPSLMGFGHTELSCMGVQAEDARRLKTSVRVAAAHGGSVLWLDAESPQYNNSFAAFLEDEELFTLLRDNADAVVILDKRLGAGRHLSVQSGALGCWLSGVCGSWGANVESWIWYEEGYGGYDDLGGMPHAYGTDAIVGYPPALAGIDTVCDLAGGATVFSCENLNLCLEDGGEPVLTETFWSVIYPLYQRMLHGAIPTREEVAAQIRVAYRVTDRSAPELCGTEAPILEDLYGPSTEWVQTYSGYGVSKMWLPKTGRYYLLPFLPGLSEPSVLPEAQVLDAQSYAAAVGHSAASKRAYFDSLYPETYTGNATLYRLPDGVYLFHNSENLTGTVQMVAYALTNSVQLHTALYEHSLVIARQQGDTLSLEVQNLRLDTRAFFAGRERQDMLLYAYLEGERLDAPEDQRAVTWTLTGLAARPSVSVAGFHVGQAEEQWNAASGTYTLQLILNGRAEITLTGIG